MYGTQETSPPRVLGQGLHQKQFQDKSVPARCCGGYISESKQENVSPYSLLEPGTSINVSVAQKQRYRIQIHS